MNLDGLLDYLELKIKNNKMAYGIKNKLEIFIKV